jgi:hypothetical protein
VMEEHYLGHINLPFRRCAVTQAMPGTVPVIADELRPDYGRRRKVSC